MKNKYLPTERASATRQAHQSFFTRIAITIFVGFTLFGCKKPEEVIQPENPVYSIETRNYHDQLKKAFGKALSPLLFEEEGLRSLIREEALKQFNHDYEVLYHMIKDRPVNGNKTFRDLLRERTGGDESLLKEIEKQLPLLTIMVPELPNNSFSAKTWDVATQLPLVGLRVHSTQGVPMLVGDGSEFNLPFDQIPGYPVVVIKDNERVITTASAGENTFKAPNTSFYYAFTDRNFNNLANRNAAARVVFTPIAQKLIDARTIMDPIQGWHRDYIYYDLTPNNTKGQFKLDFKEKITSFRFNYGMEGYQAIADQEGDPRFIQAYPSFGENNRSGAAAWTDGSFEFSVNAIVNSKVTGLAAVAPKFRARGYDLFDVEYEVADVQRCRWYLGCFGSDLYIYRVKSVTPKMWFPPANAGIDLINWDLEKYAPTMAISIKEVDLPQTVTTRETSSTEFAANFAVDPVDGLFKKIGMKFGGSAKQVFSAERTVVTLLESDNLGDNATVEFGDKVIIDHAPFFFLGRIYITREYSTGMVSFSVEPALVQP